MKQLAQMTDQELQTELAATRKLREQVEDEDDYDDYLSALDDPHELIEGELIDALAALHGKETEAKRPSEKEGAPKSPPKGYPQSRDDYADPQNYKYPLDTEAHVRAALSYFSKPANRGKGGYSAEEQKFMWKRIIAAAKKFDITLSDDVLKHAEALGGGDNEMELDPERLTEAVAKAVEQAMAKYNLTVKQPNINDIPTHGAALEELKKSHADVTKNLAALQASHSALAKDVEDLKQKMAAKPENGNGDGNGNGNGDNGNGNGDGDGNGDGKGKEDAAPPNPEENRAVEKKKEVEGGSGKAEKKKEAVAQGQVATPAMANSEAGVSPPSHEIAEKEYPPDFAGVMTRASRRRRESS